MKKSAISLISYDAHLLPKSIESYYNYVDEIILGLDEERISWSHNNFSFDENKLWKELKKIDFKNKINIVEGNYHSHKEPLENDTKERESLKEECSGDWVFSFDADEILVNANDFFNKYFPIVQDYDNVELLFTWFFPYAEQEDVTFMISEANRQRLVKHEKQGFAIKKSNKFTYCRWSDASKKLLTPLAVLHYSFCRTKKQNIQKLSNFGHSDKSSNDRFYPMMCKVIEDVDNVTLENYMHFTNLKYNAGEPEWPALMPVKTSQVMNLCEEEAKLIL